MTQVDDSWLFKILSELANEVELSRYLVEQKTIRPATSFGKIQEFKANAEQAILAEINSRYVPKRGIKEALDELKGGK